MSLTTEEAAAPQEAEGQDQAPRKQGPNLLTLFPTFSFPPGGGGEEMTAVLAEEAQR